MLSPRIVCLVVKRQQEVFHVEGLIFPAVLLQWSGCNRFQGEVSLLHPVDHGVPYSATRANKHSSGRSRKGGLPDRDYHIEEPWGHSQASPHWPRPPWHNLRRRCQHEQDQRADQPKACLESALFHFPVPRRSCRGRPLNLNRTNG